MFAPDESLDNINFIKLENIKSDLFNFFSTKTDISLSYNELDDLMEKKVNCFEKKKKIKFINDELFKETKNKHYSEYYDDDLVLLIYKYDKEYIDRFNYNFDKLN